VRVRFACLCVCTRSPLYGEGQESEVPTYDLIHQPNYQTGVELNPVCACVCACVQACATRRRFAKGGELKALSTTEFQPDLYAQAACGTDPKCACGVCGACVQACATWIALAEGRR
jgi:hypothetical protein